MDLLIKTKKDIKESKTISRYLSKNRKEIEIEILVDEVIYLLISKEDIKKVLKIGTYTETSNCINRIDFDLHKRLHYSDNDLGIIFNNLA
jgi:hypothetical protein